MKCVPVLSAQASADILPPDLALVWSGNALPIYGGGNKAEKNLSRGCASFLVSV